MVVLSLLGLTLALQPAPVHEPLAQPDSLASAVSRRSLSSAAPLTWTPASVPQSRYCQWYSPHLLTASSPQYLLPTLSSVSTNTRSLFSQQSLALR